MIKGEMVKATVVNNIHANANVPGAVKIGKHGMYYICPCGCQAKGYLNFRPAPSPGVSAWDFDRENLTLSPSVNHVNHWHGYLRNGYWSLA